LAREAFEGEGGRTATEQVRVATQNELKLRAESGATLGELLDLLDQRNRRLGSSLLTDDQYEHLQLYCWALHKRQSSGLLWGQARVWGSLEEDIGA
jgi:hypothetical protein